MKAGSVAGVIALLLVAGTSHAMMAPAFYEEARATAPLHLEVTITAMRSDGAAIGDCRVEGEVATVFRDDSGLLAPGDSIAFEVDCLRADADPNEIPDCVLFERTEDLVAGATLDVYLERSGLFDYAVVAGQVDVVASPGRPGS